MRYVIAATFVVSLVMCRGGVAQHDNAAQSPAPTPGGVVAPASAGMNSGELTLRAEDGLIVAALEKTLPEARYQAAALEQVLCEFAEDMKVNVLVDWRDLIDTGVERDAPVTLALRNLPRSRVLQAILDAAGEIRLGYEVREGLLLIATQERLDRDLVVRMYPVRDLLTAIGEAWRREAGPTPAQPATQPSHCFPAAPEPCTTRAEEKLREVLLLAVEPDSWRENGGQGAACTCNATLVVRQNRRVQRAVGRFLADLRAAGAADSGPGEDLPRP